MTTPVRFRHVNFLTKKKEDGSVVKKPSRLKYTVAYSFTKTGDELEVTYGVAQCRAGATGDTFSRAEGRARAESRLQFAQRGATPDLRYGKFKVKDNGINVGRYVAEKFEAERKAALAAQNAK